jgi:hypothetical protein
LVVNFTPNSAAVVSEDELRVGTLVGFHTEQGQIVVVEVVSARDAAVEDPFRVAVMTAV